MLRKMSLLISWMMILTGEELEQMKKVVVIAPWTELDLGCGGMK